MRISEEKHEKCRNIARGIRLQFKQAWGLLKSDGEIENVYWYYTKCRHTQLVFSGGTFGEPRVAFWPVGFSNVEFCLKTFFFEEEYGEVLDMFEAFLIGERQACVEWLDGSSDTYLSKSLGVA